MAATNKRLAAKLNPLVAGIRQAAYFSKKSLHLSGSYFRTIKRHAQTDNTKRKTSAALSALTAAALALPGISSATTVDTADIQASHYEEYGRDFWTGPDGQFNEPDPITVDSIYATTNISAGEQLNYSVNYQQDTWSGATPILTAPEGFLTVTGASPFPAYPTAWIDEATLSPQGFENGKKTQKISPIQVMTYASPETRTQLDASAIREWDDLSVTAGGGVSDESDFYSRFVNLGSSLDLNNKLTTLNIATSYTDSDINANLGAPQEWIDYGLYRNGDTDASVDLITAEGQENLEFNGTRQNWSGSLGITQIINKNTTFSAGFGYSKDRGFLENPYKLVLIGFADPDTNPLIGKGYLLTGVYSVAESRPDEHTQSTGNLQLLHYFSAPDAALSVDYYYTDDSWGADSNTLELQWRQAFTNDWLITPRIRYYSQSEADFYQPYFLVVEKAPRLSPQDRALDFNQIPLKYYSSDYRLSGYGALSGGLSISKQFARGITLEAGIERYIHKGSLKLGGNGEDSYADFKSTQFNLGITMQFDVMENSDQQNYFSSDTTDKHHAHHHNHGDHPGSLAPAGLMYEHMMDKTDSMMLAYRFMQNRQAGNILHGEHRASDADITVNGCYSEQCSMVPSSMTMRMHMIDFMYAPTDWLNLMAMMQYSDMKMSMQYLDGAVISSGGAHNHGGHSDHATAGLGDTALSALVKLYNSPQHEIHAALAVNFPTGNVDEKMNSGEYMDYGMQTGSGTRDWQPSLTYNGQHNKIFWGSQAGKIFRPDKHNDSGYTLGDTSQASAWLGYKINPSWAVTVRPVYTDQDAIDGQFDGPVMGMSTADYPENYGGRFWDVGLGLSFSLPGRMLAGDRIKMEWLEPVKEDVNGYQLERHGTFSFSWSMNF